VGELAGPFKMTPPAVKVLRRAGLISQRRKAQSRPCKLKAQPLKEAADWVDQYRRFWEESFERLDEYLKELQAKESGAGRQKSLPKPKRT